MTGLQIEILLLVASFAALVFVVAFFIATKVSENERRTASRVEQLVGKQAGTEVILEKIRHNKQKKKNNGDFVQRKSITSKIGDNILDQLMAADIAMRADEFATMWIMLAILPPIFIIFVLGNMYVGIILALFGSIGPILYVRLKKKKRTKKFEEQLADALMVCANSLKSGLSFQQAMEAISKDMLPPISAEFGRAVKEMNIGVGMDEALENIEKRVASEEFKIAVIAVSVQRQTGGNLSEILMTISHTLKERFALKSEIASVTATGRMSGGVVAVMPIGVTLLLNMFNPGYLNPMLNSNMGKVMLVYAIVSEILGILAIKKITTIKY